ncbi:MAG TPA: F0F1 ATP synthase subunit epsilon [Streptosporangiaceae bacterium]|jgi:F-type H+-transporting ATPase subunit epsilon|nr:F0F1 ATP synthase subunit epsilon [Streptosporangiaceae bacterium]
MHVALVEPEGELWSGSAEMVIARTLDGEIGLLSNHAPVIGILYEGSMVQIRPDGGGPDVFAAVSGGFVSMADNRVSILARQAQLGADVNTAAVDELLAEALQSAGAIGPEEPADVRYYRSLLRAAQG